MLFEPLKKTWCSSQTPLLFETPRYFGILEEHGFNQFLNFKALISAGRAVIPEPLIFMLEARDFRPDTHPQSDQRRNVVFWALPTSGGDSKANCSLVVPRMRRIRQPSRAEVSAEGKSNIVNIPSQEPAHAYSHHHHHHHYPHDHIPLLSFTQEVNLP